MEEIWKDIEGYEGVYQISNLGRVKRLVSEKCKKERIISITKNERDGYCRVMLSKHGHSKRFLLHRLLAIHFIPNTYNKPCIDHINGVKHDNRIDNLRWCTCSENNNFLLARENNSLAHKILAQNTTWRNRNREAVKKAMSRQEVRQKLSESMKRNWSDPEYANMQKEKHFQLPVLQFDLEMRLVGEFKSINEASRCTNTNSSSIIRCCKGKQKTANNYIWKYKQRQL